MARLNAGAPAAAAAGAGARKTLVRQAWAQRQQQQQQLAWRREQPPESWWQGRQAEAAARCNCAVAAPPGAGELAEVLEVKDSRNPAWRTHTGSRSGGRAGGLHLGCSAGAAASARLWRAPWAGAGGWGLGAQCRPRGTTGGPVRAGWHSGGDCVTVGSKRGTSTSGASLCVRVVGSSGRGGERAGPAQWALLSSVQGPGGGQGAGLGRGVQRGVRRVALDLRQGPGAGRRGQGVARQQAPGCALVLVPWAQVGQQRCTQRPAAAALCTGAGVGDVRRPCYRTPRHDGVRPHR